MSLRAADVFTPSSYPNLTYVDRGELRLEARLADALETPGDIISVSGPSKSGKTVLVEKVVGRDNLIIVSGAGLEDGDELWSRCLDWMGAPSSTTSESSWDGSVGASGDAGGEVGIPLVAKGKISASGHTSVTHSSGSSEVSSRAGMVQVANEIAHSDFVVFIDDFHYMDRGAQADAARQIKAASALGIKICVASVPHRSDDVVRSNPELRGRVQAVDLSYWSDAHLGLIAAKGFAEMRLDVDGSVVAHFVRECSGSPQLMQALCLQLCQNLDYRERNRKLTPVSVDPSALSNILGDATSRSDFSSLTRRLTEGPKTRGTERKLHELHDGSTGDVYPVVLRAIASDPPRLSFSYSELQSRVAAVCVDQAPRPQSVSQACKHLADISRNMYPDQRIVEFDGDEGVLEIIDPYLLFYLRNR